MIKKFSQSFKIQAVEKALIRNDQTTIEEVAEQLGVARSTLSRWINEAQNQQFDPSSTNDDVVSRRAMPEEKRPSDWSQAEKMAMIIRCGSLDEESVNALCRGEGIYPHHIKQWEADFLAGSHSKGSTPTAVEAKKLRQENKQLKRELTRKEKALAEAAALLILQKKVNALWESDEED